MWYELDLSSILSFFLKPFNFRGYSAKFSKSIHLNKKASDAYEGVFYLYILLTNDTIYNTIKEE